LSAKSNVQGYNEVLSQEIAVNGSQTSNDNEVRHLWLEGYGAYLHGSTITAVTKKANLEVLSYCKQQVPYSLPVPTPQKQIKYPLLLHTTGRLGGVESALTTRFVGGVFEGLDNPSVTCDISIQVLRPNDVLACQATSVDDRSLEFFVKVKTARAATVVVPKPSTIDCGRITPHEMTALESLNGETTCSNPNGIEIPKGAVNAPQPLYQAIYYGPTPPAGPLTQDQMVASNIDVVYDHNDSSWAVYYLYPSAANTGLFPTTAGLVHQSGSTWTVLIGPSPNLNCGNMTSVPPAVLAAFHIQVGAGCSSGAVTATP
jgi:hypothetical protein